MILANGAIYAPNGNRKKTRLENSHGGRGTKVGEGYEIVVFNRKGKKLRVRVHQLVCLAFHGEPKEEQTLVRHLNDISHDNRASNLRWGTHAENVRDTLDTGGGTGKFTAQDIRDIRASTERKKDLAERYGVSYMTIWEIQTYKTWKDLV